jgi:hypothetical protein
MNEPTTMIWNDMRLVKIDDVGTDFASWLYGQTMPYVAEDKNPMGWAYYEDYLGNNILDTQNLS